MKNNFVFFLYFVKIMSSSVIAEDVTAKRMMIIMSQFYTVCLCVSLSRPWYLGRM